ncbi:MBL fold metallo-hydrolase [Nordella sp. HKS 07]|uniref:MBL fold metallo-hydrolase n=1 Tax=Nordella sp. HKS 07 TaxID=2712222 RepID=UPI0013E1C27E|nr:MBL fold metallo-hydrolase [Nordella sp. HKS 07]QIG50225.1 MBL fold metallo-hydrolase [Nordella sp. HKS 07]
MTKPNIRWFDDWYVVDEIAPGLYGIGEPKYYQINWNYLIVGDERALVFDTGPGVRDITPVVQSLTDRPVTALLSHLHFDHTGNFHRFADTALADLPILRDSMRDGLFHAPEEMFLGARDGVSWTPMAIGQWWSIGQRVDLGGKELEIVATPGHSPESISLFDREQGILLAADFLYLGNLYGQIPGASLPDYLAAAEALDSLLPDDALILGAHGKPLPDGTHVAPRLARRDLEDLMTGLNAIRDGELPPLSQNPDRYRINDRIALLAGPASYDMWR